MGAVTGRGRFLRWWLPPVDAARVAWLRVLLYLVVAVNVAFINNSVGHGDTPELYQPVTIMRDLGVPAPTVAWLQTLQVLLIAGALVGAAGRWPRLAGWPVAAMYLLWQFYEMSYGKIDHDEFALIAGLFVLPTVGRVPLRAGGIDEAASFAVRCVQVAVTATYALSAYAKMRFGTWDWANGAIFVWSLSRRGHPWSVPLLQHPGLLHASQWGLLVLETASPLMLVVRPRLAALGAAGWALFHLVTWASIGIHFLPTAICLTAFWPLEALPAWRDRLRAVRAARGQPPAVSPPPAGGYVAARR